MWRLCIPLIALFAVSCATAVSGPRETISVTSSPSDAAADLVCERHSASETTPAKLVIRRNVGDCVLTVSKNGFEPAVVTIKQGVNPYYWGNMIFVPVVPASVFLIAGGDSQEMPAGIGLLGVAAAIFGADFYTGAVHVHRPAAVDVVLKPKP
jgi:hypothetical protein